MTDATTPAAPTRGLAFYRDLEPPRSDMRADILAGLSKPQKTIPAKYLYDAEGSAIFEQITEAPEYYVTRTELALLDAVAPDLRELAGPGAVVLEPGAGALVKIRKLLDALETPAAFVGMDISGEHLLEACEALAEERDRVAVGAVCHDFTQPMDFSTLPLPEGRRIVFFPGSTIGNFELIDALAVLRNLRGWLREGDALLIGADLRKDRETLEAAYDDAGGVTAAFNFNLIERLNRELDGDMDPAGFRYAAHWNPYRSRVEMYLQARADMRFTLAGERFVIREEETIHTENSHKFTVGGFHDLAGRAGLVAKKAWVSRDPAFSLHWLEPAREA